MLGSMERERSTAAQVAGDVAEDVVVARLETSGWRILGRNVRVGRSELDIVAVDLGPPAFLVVVEVRYRGRRDFGLAEETLDWRKRAALRRGIGVLLEAGRLPDGTVLPVLPVRLDLVAVDRVTADRHAEGRLSIRHHRAIDA